MLATHRLWSSVGPVVSAGPLGGGGVAVLIPSSAACVGPALAEADTRSFQMPTSSSSVNRRLGFPSVAISGPGAKEQEVRGMPRKQLRAKKLFCCTQSTSDEG